MLWLITLKNEEFIGRKKLRKKSYLVTWLAKKRGCGQFIKKKGSTAQTDEKNKTATSFQWFIVLLSSYTKYVNGRAHQNYFIDFVFSVS